MGIRRAAFLALAIAAGLFVAPAAARATGFTAIVFEHSGFDGGRLEVAAPEGQTVNLRDRGRNCHFWCPDNWDDTISSVMVPRFVKLTLFDGPDATGSCVTVDGITAPGLEDLPVALHQLGLALPRGQTWNDRASSVVLNWSGAAPDRCPFVNGLIPDGGFEQWSGTGFPASWRLEGTSSKGVNQDQGQARSGRNNGWIRTSSASWNAVGRPALPIPGRRFTLLLRAWVRTSPNVQQIVLGMRHSGSGLPIWEFRSNRSQNGYQLVQFRFGSGEETQFSFYVGFVGPGRDAWMQVDDVTLQAVA